MDTAEHQLASSIKIFLNQVRCFRYDGRSRPLHVWSTVGGELQGRTLQIEASFLRGGGHGDVKGEKLKLLSSRMLTSTSYFHDQIGGD